MMLHESQVFRARWFGRYGYSSSPDDAAGSIVMMAGAIAVVMLVLIIWAVVKAIDLVLRAWRQSRGKSRALRIALFTWLGLVVLLAMSLVAMANNTVPLEIEQATVITCALLLGIATVALLLTARVTELRYRQTFMSEPETLVTKVLHRPWWTTKDRQVA